MPRDLPGDVGATAEGNRKRKRSASPRQGGHPGAGTSHRVPPSTPDTADLNDRISIVQQNSTEWVPTMVKMSLSQLSDNSKQLAKMARQATKTYDMTPQFILGQQNLDQMVSPLTGESLTLQEVRRLAGSRLGALSVLRYIYGAVDQNNEVNRVLRGRGLEPGEAFTHKDVSRILDTVGAAYRDENIPIRDGIAVALSLVGRGVNAKILESNVRAVERWSKTGIRGTWQQRLGIASAAAEAGVKMENAEDVIKFIYPEAVALSGEQRTELKGLGLTDDQIDRGLDYAHERALALKAGEPLPAPPTDIPGYALGTIVGARDLRVEKEVIQEFEGTIEEGLKLAESLKDGIELREEAWENSPLNKYVLTPTLNALSALDSKFFQPIAITGKELLEQPNTGVGSGIPIGAYFATATSARNVIEGVPTIDQFETNWDQYIDDIQGAWKGEIRLSDTLVRDWNIPRWNAEAIEFIAGWYIDPLVVAGKAGRIAAMRNVNPQVLAPLRAGAVGERKMGKYIGKVDEFVESNFSAFSKAMRSTDDAKIIRFSDDFHEVMGSSPFDVPLLQKVRKEMALRGGKVTDDELRDVFRSHFLPGNPTPGSLADLGFRARADEALAARRAFAANPFSQKHLDNVQRANARVWEDVLDERTLVPPRFELPGKNIPVPGAGLTRVIGRQYNDLLGETRLGTALAKLPTMNPGNVLKVHDNPQRWFKLKAKRAGFDTPGVRDWETRATLAAASDAPEAELKKLLNEFDHEAMYVRTRPRGIPDEAADEILEELRAGGAKFNVEQRFSARNTLRFTRDGTPYVSKASTPSGSNMPVLESELVNFLPSVDPIDMERAVTEYLGYAKKLRQGLIRAAQGVDAVPEITKAAKLPIAAWSAVHVIKPTFSFGMRLFKLQAVARPAYVFRVVLGDELMRALATNQSFYEQALSYGWGLRSVTTPPTPDAGAFTKARAALKGRIDELGERRIGDQIIDRPGALKVEPLANTQLDYSELAHEGAKATQRKLAKYSTSGEWDVLSPAQVNHEPQWIHALNNVIGNSRGGRRALDAIQDGTVTSRDGLYNLMLNWSRTRDGRKFLTQIGKSDNAAMWAGEAADQAWGYTLGDPELARLALYREVDPATVAKFPKTTTVNGEEVWGRPYVHGPRLAKAFGGDLHTWVNRWYGLNVRWPENYLNRQPYYAGFKQRAEAAYARMGLDLKDPKIAKAVDDASRDFALANSKKIMFDFTENSRIGELAGFAFPFMQPWQENIAVWGHILTKRNPAMVGYVNRVTQLGINTGFISQDPDTKEWVIPETWWMFTAPLWWAIGGREGGGGMSPLAGIPGMGGVGDKERSFSLTTPLTSLNLFANTVFRVPEGTPLVGGMPLPAPGASPFLQFFGQQATKQWGSETGLNGSIYEYLFQMGPGADTLPEFVKSTFIPRWMNKLIPAFYPDWDTDLSNQVTQEFLALQEYLGQEVNLERAQKQAKMAMPLLALQAAFFPGAAQREYPHSWLETLYHEKIEEFGDVSEASKWMNQQYPEYTMITIPKTMATLMSNNLVGGEEFLEVFGKNLPAPDSVRPASSRYYDAALSHPEFREFATDPETAPFAMVLMFQSSNPKADEFDMSSYNAARARGDIERRSGEAVFEDFKSRAFWNEWNPIQNHFDNGFFRDRDPGAIQLGKGDGDLPTREAYRGTFVPGFKQIEKEGGYPGDNGAWDALARERALELEMVSSEYPEIAGKYVTPKPGGGSMFIFENEGRWPEGVHPHILKSAYEVVMNPTVKDMPAVLGLRSYLDMRQETRQKLINKGIDGIMDPAAKSIRKDYERRKDAIIESFPEFEIFYNTYFDHDLNNGLPTKGEERVAKWETSGSLDDNRRAEQYDEFTTEYRAFSAEIKEARASGDTDVSVNAVYQARTALVNQWYKRDPRIVQTYYDALTEGQRRQEREGLVTTPTAFYSRFDWKLMGVELTNRASRWLEEMQTKTEEISAWEERMDLTRATSDRRSQLSRWINQKFGKDESFDTAVKHMGTWGFGAIAAGYTGEGKDKKDLTKSEKAWRAIIEYANGYRVLSEEAKIHGDAQPFKTFDREGAIWYNNARDNVGNYVEVLRKWDKNFKREWDEIAAGYTGPGGKLIFWLFPEVHFKLGQVDAF